MSEKWPVGVFTSIDAGLGVQFPVVVELGIPTIQLHAPVRASRTPDSANAFLEKLEKHKIKLTCVFGGFDGESYADIPTVEQTVGLVPEATRTARLKEMCEISDFACLLGCGVIGLHLGFVPHDSAHPIFKDVVAVTDNFAIMHFPMYSLCTWRQVRRPPNRYCNSSMPSIGQTCL